MKFLKTLFTLSCLFLLLQFPLLGQAKEPIPVGVTPIEWSSRSSNPTYVSMIYDHITQRLQENSAVKVVDRQGWELIREEQELLKTEPFILTDNITQGMTLGAKKLVTTKVYLTDINSVGSDGDGVEITISLYVAVVDVESGVVEDNILLSTRGLENSDKMIEVIKAVRRISWMSNVRFLKRLIEILELFDVLAKYEVAGLSQADSFKEALNQLDKVLIPFFNYHFKGETEGYTPDRKKQVTPVTDGPNDFKEDGTAKYPVIEKLDEEEIRILGGQYDGLRPMARLDLVVERDFEETTWEGEKVQGVETTVLGTVAFQRYEGDFSVYKWTKSGDMTLEKALEEQGVDGRIFVVDPNPKEASIQEQDSHFPIVGYEGDQQLVIYGSADDGIKKLSRFSVVREEVKEYPDLNGRIARGIHREELTVLKPVEDRGDKQILELTSKDDVSIKEIVPRPRAREAIFVTFKLKNY